MEELSKKYQTIAAGASSFIVEQGKWGIHTLETPEISMPTHLLSEEVVEESLVSVSMSQKCCSHMEAVLASKADLKATKAGGLVRVWPLHF